MSFKSDLLNELDFRGFLYQCTDFESLDDLLCKEKITFYIGFDVTADSLHVGHLTQIFLLKIFQKYGHSPIILLGGGTTKIGDPSGRNKMRQMLNNDDLIRNFNGIRESFSKFLSFDGKNPAIIVNNDDWLKDIKYIDFLREFGSNFSVNKMVAMDTFKQRLQNEQNLSFLEFNYPLLQSFDFLELLNRYNCVLQMGGSDQWGNITNGTELIRKITNKPVYGLTAPLLTTSDGKKMGKSADGAVWINKDKLPSYEFWQYWRNVSDQDVIKFIKLFTDCDQSLINEFSELKFEKLNTVKIFLADSITKLCRSDEELNRVHALLDGSNVNYDTINIPYDEVVGTTISELILRVGLLESNGEIKRLVANSGIYINGDKLLDHKTIINDDFIVNGVIKISIGKKKLVVVKLI